MYFDSGKKTLSSKHFTNFVTEYKPVSLSDLSRGVLPDESYELDGLGEWSIWPRMAGLMDCGRFGLAELPELLSSRLPDGVCVSMLRVPLVLEMSGTGARWPSGISRWN